jgi:hypothetical protein
MQMNAENFARAATHAQALLDRFGADAPSAELAQSILEQVEARLGRYEVSCTPECALSVDNLAYFVEPARRHRLYLIPGRVSLEAHYASGRTASRSVTTSAGETARIELIEPASPPSSGAHAAPAPRALQSGSERAPAQAPDAAFDARKGLPPVVPWITGAAAVVCGGATIWAALDTKRLHDEYLEHPTEEKWNAGVARQTMTNVLAVSTAALGVATITLAFLVRDSTKTSVRVSPALGPKSASLAVAGRF